MNAIHSNASNNKRWAWMWVAYIGFFFIQPILEPSVRLWALTLAVTAIFFVLYASYIRACSSMHPALYWIIGAFFLVGLLSFPWNNGASTFFVYAGAFLPFVISSKRTVLSLVALESIFIAVEGYLFHVPHGYHHFFFIAWPNTLIAIFLVFIIGGSNIFFAEQRRADSKLRMAHEEVEALAAVAERERIARDLHDVLGHTLSVIVLKAELAKRLIASDPARATTEIADVETIGRSALTEVREAIGGYRSRGLCAELDAARSTLASAGVTLETDSRPLDTVGLSAAEETVLALALREAVTNIVRHARAKNCRLRFVTENGRRKLLVQDDGEHPLAREGNGLRGMRERLESLGGSLRVEREHGTRLLIEIPLRVGVVPGAATS
jgi:two-component system sensor histidine kinase DesK